MLEASTESTKRFPHAIGSSRVRGAQNLDILRPYPFAPVLPQQDWLKYYDFPFPKIGACVKNRAQSSQLI